MKFLQDVRFQESQCSRESGLERRTRSKTFASWEARHRLSGALRTCGVDLHSAPFCACLWASPRRAPYLHSRPAPSPHLPTAVRACAQPRLPEALQAFLLGFLTLTGRTTLNPLALRSGALSKAESTSSCPPYLDTPAGKADLHLLASPTGPLVGPCCRGWTVAAAVA